jgi:hypothetical protein
MLSEVGPVVKKKFVEKMHFTWIYNGDFERPVFRFPNVYLQIIIFLFNIFPSNFHSKYPE